MTITAVLVEPPPLTRHPSLVGKPYPLKEGWDWVPKGEKLRHGDLFQWAYPPDYCDEHNTSTIIKADLDAYGERGVHMNPMQYPNRKFTGYIRKIGSV